MAGINKSFGNVSVLSDVRFALQPGEIVALLGANGAGKSTLMKILSGVYARDAGTIAVDGKEVDLADPRAAAACGIRFLPQEISVMPDMTVSENICLPVLARIGPRIDRPAMAARSAGLLAELGFPDLDPEAYVGQLAVAEQRIVEIARALAGEARILVMDEPTAALSEHDAEQIFAALLRIKERGTSVVYISHERSSGSPTGLKCCGTGGTQALSSGRKRISTACLPQCWGAMPKRCSRRGGRHPMPDRCLRCGPLAGATSWRTSASGFVRARSWVSSVLSVRGSSTLAGSCSAPLAGV
jgi:ABC-type branched-subunit amino acid transport system ATPase component